MLLACKGSLATFLARHTGACLCGGGGKRRTAGSGPRASLTELPGAASGMTVVHGHAELLPHVLPRGGKPSAWAGCERTAPSPGGCRWEHRVCLPRSSLFVDTVGTDGSSVPTMALFFPSSI